MYNLPVDPRLIALFLVSGALVGAGATYIGMSLDEKSGEEVSEDLVSALEAQTGQEMELVNYEEENGLYKVNMKSQEDTLVTYHMTKNGKMFTSNMADFERVSSLISSRTDFRDCLEDQEVTLYGNITQQATQAQIQVLGGERVVEDIYEDVNDDRVLEEATSLGLERVPALYYDGSLAQGINSIEEVADFTGCEYSMAQ